MIARIVKSFIAFFIRVICVIRSIRDSNIMHHWFSQINCFHGLLNLSLLILSV